MNKLIKIISLFIIAGIFCSCEEIVNIDLNNSEPQIVIEGNISDTIGPYFVRISRTVNFNQNSNTPGISGAMVIISDNNGVKDTLIEATNGYYRTNNLRVIRNSYYTLDISIDGVKYHSTSFMPSKTNLDSVYVRTDNGGFGVSIFLIVPKYQDPAGVRNTYRFNMFINGKQTRDVFVQSDERRDGQIISQSLRSVDTIRHGDTITLEMQCIDENIYRYFYALALNIKTGMDQTQTPTNPPTNIEGCKLGYFSAHTTQRRTVVVP
jgi:hypothetical protein